jgi:hypothetical protein
MSGRPTLPFDDATLTAALRELSAAVDWPTAAPDGAPDLAMRVRVRLTERRTRPRVTSWRPGRWPRALVLALLALVVLAAVAGAIGLGLPNLRLILGGPSASPPATVAPSATPAGAPGSRLGLGRPVTLAEAAAQAGRELLVPADPTLGPPDAVYVDPAKANQVSMVWAARTDLPAKYERGIGLVFMTFAGTTDGGLFEKILQDGTTVERLRVGDDPGYWLEGTPHFFFYRTADGRIVDDARRWVGDALIWSNGTTTYRLETSLGRDAALRIAASLQ